VNGPELPQPQGMRADLDLLTPDDVCTLLKVRKSWLYDTVESGALEAVRLGKQLRFRPSAVARYLDASTGRR
jgi:excisionase family DNA binding protein